MKKSPFIVFEGVEGVGKSTQVQLLAQWMASQDIAYYLTREPGGTPLAEDIRNLVLQPRAESMCAETELLLMMAARLQHWHQVIVPKLYAGRWVLCDRFIDSSVAYQGAGRGLSQAMIRKMHNLIASQMVPDLVIVLDMDLTASQQRVVARGEALDRMEQASTGFFEKARACFLDSARSNPGRYVCIDASQSIATIAAEMQTIVQHQLLKGAV